MNSSEIMGFRLKKRNASRETQADADSRLQFGSGLQSVFSAAVASSNGCQPAQSAIALSVCAKDKIPASDSVSRLASVRPVHLPPLISSSTLQFSMQLISTFATLCSQCGRR